MCIVYKCVKSKKDKIVCVFVYSKMCVVLFEDQSEKLFLEHKENFEKFITDHVKKS